ncbi:MAG: serine hydrolase [Gammaproteobacteria bacterium]
MKVLKHLTGRVMAVLLSAISPCAIADLRNEPPMTSAQHWLVAEQGEVLFARNAAAPVQIASLTKLMTALVVLDVLGAEAKWVQQRVSVSNLAATLPGTSAQLETGDRLTVEALLYGLLLPSGNDAATALAEAVGKRLDADGHNYLQRFIARMNLHAIALGMRDTKFVDVHGMGENISTAQDLLRLSTAVLQHDYLRRVVGAKEYRAEIRSNRGGVREPVWRNTNELLGEFYGVKTGHTNIAGGCLVLVGDHSGRERIVIVLNAANQRLRFMDAYNLYQWSFNATPRRDKQSAEGHQVNPADLRPSENP